MRPNQTISLTPDKQAWLMQHRVQARPTSLTIEIKELLARASMAVALMPEMWPRTIVVHDVDTMEVALFAMLNCASDMGAIWKWQKLLVINYC